MTKIHRSTSPFNSRYAYDTGECSQSNGFAQLDTGQDASYYGTWANPTTFTIVNFCEGDLYRTTCDTPEEFVRGIREIYEWNVARGWVQEGKGFIDPGYPTDWAVNPIYKAFEDLGIGELCH